MRPEIVSLLIALACSSGIPIWASDSDGSGNLAKAHSWKDLQETECPEKSAGLHYYQFKTDNGSNAYLVVADVGKGEWQLKPLVNTPTATTTAAAKRAGCAAAVNGAFFNLSNGESTSFVVIDGTEVCNPTTNKALTENPKLKPFLKTIFSRSELRILQNKRGLLQLEVTPHNAPVSKNLRLVHSIQAGPRLLPTMTDAAEAFVRTEADGKSVDSIGVNKTAARTAFGITKDRKHILLLCIASKRQDEFSSGVTLAQLAALMKQLGCAEAINFDGGTSTTMTIKTAPNNYKMVCGREPETLVKSVLVLYKQ